MIRCKDVLIPNVEYWMYQLILIETTFDSRGATELSPNLLLSEGSIVRGTVRLLLSQLLSPSMQPTGKSSLGFHS